MHSERKHFIATTAGLLDGLYAAALRLTGSRAEAEDLVQDAYLQAWRHWDHFEPGTNARAWMHRIVVNAYISSWRRKRRERKALDVDTDPGRRELLLSSSQKALEGEDGGVHLEGLSRSTQAALAELPEEYRMVVVMADLQEMSYREIADALGCPIGTVMSRLHRGRKGLARKLGLAPAAAEETAQAA